MDKEAKSKVLEKGNVYFFYSPKVGQTEVSQGSRDVQHLKMILSAEGENRYRMFVIGRKKMPTPERKTKKDSQRIWGYVDGVSKRAENIEDELDEFVYETKTSGIRVQPAARPAGEGKYCIVRHGDHTHFAYVLELPEKRGDVQKAFNIEEEASYILAVKNPESSSPRGLGPRQRADFPKALQSKFHGRRFVPADPPDFLNYEGAEVIFVGADLEVEAELGINLASDKETESTAEIFNDLRLEKDRHPLEPLLHGLWK